MTNLIGRRVATFCAISSLLALQACTGSDAAETAMVLIPQSSAPKVTTAAVGQVAVNEPDGKPIIFNASGTVKAGDILYLQGHDFGEAPVVMMQASGSSPEQQLPIVNHVGNWVAAQLPAGIDGAVIVTLVNEGKASEPVKLNAARAKHFDTLDIVPSGYFRVFGENLMVPGKAPKITINGMAAGYNSSHSDEHMLAIRAPAGLKAMQGAVVTIDNGNGSGPSVAEQTVNIIEAGRKSPFKQLFTGWTNSFAPFASHVTSVPCEGGKSISSALQNAINSAASAGGGTVRLSAGSCTIDSGVSLANNVIVEGNSASTTQVRYTTNYPIWAEGMHHVALRNLTLTNGGAQEGMVLKKSSFVVLQNVKFNLGTQKQMFLDANSNILVTGCTFNQTGSINQQSPYLLTGSKGLVFERNTTKLMMGASAFERVTDAYIARNTFIRNAAKQDEAGTLHMMTIDFASRIAIVNNRFRTDSGAINNKTRNDGESILTEGGGPNRTEYLGLVENATATTLTDNGMQLRTDPFWEGYFPDNYGIAIVAGKGAGQTRTITDYTNGTVTVDRAWDVIPDETSRYAAFVWGLEKTLIKNNIFSNMPRGIWLYQAGIRDVNIIDNNFTEGGGIYLRAYQNLDKKMFDPIYNVRITGNVVRNQQGRWMSHVASVFVNADAKAFGIAMLGITIDKNQLTANRPNSSSGWEEYAGEEGYFNMMRVENYDGYESMQTPRVLGTIFKGNTCLYCAVEYRIGTGAGGTIIDGSASMGGGQFFDNWKTTSSPELATDTVLQ